MAESKGWIDREKLMDISGRSRKVQIEMAELNGIADYPCPAGGCLLTSKEFSAKLSDLLVHDPERLTMGDIALLKVGRHFRVSGRKIVVGRNERENAALKGLLKDGLVMLEPVEVKGPACLVEGDDEGAVRVAATILARYSDGGAAPITVRFSGSHDGQIEVMPASNESIDGWRVVAVENTFKMDERKLLVPFRTDPTA